MHGRREHVVRGLAHVHVVVRMHVLAGERRDDLVRVHVRRRARPGLKDVDRELVVELAVRDAVPRGCDPVGLLPVEEAEVGVHARGSGLDATEPARHRDRNGLAGDGEVPDSLAGFRAPELLRRGGHALESRRRAVGGSAAPAGVRGGSFAPARRDRRRAPSPDSRTWRTRRDRGDACARAGRFGTYRNGGTRQRASRSHSFLRLPGPASSPPNGESGSIGRVLGLNLFAPDAGDGVVGRNRSLAEADRDERDLSLVARHVAGRVHTRDGRVHGHRIHEDLALAGEIEAPVGDGAEVGVEAEKQDERFAVEPRRLAGPGVLDGHRLDGAVTVDLTHLGRRADADVALVLESPRLVHRGLERAEALAPVDERDRQVGRVLQAECPVERGVAAADDDAVLPLEDVLPRDEVVKPAALPVVDPVELELPRLEGAVASRDDQRARKELLPGLGRQREQFFAVLRQPRQVGDLFVEVDVGAELEALFDAKVDEVLALDLRMPGDVVDVLLRVDGGDLAAELAEALDDANRGVAVARVVRGGQPYWARADHRDVADAFAHVWLDATRGEVTLMRAAGAATAARMRLHGLALSRAFLRLE